MLTSRRVAPLLFCSGFCGLVYQVGWLREFRLVFGASTAASAAVLAIFIGGLGAGSLLLGRRADAAKRPLCFYGNLELVIAGTAALSPFFLSAIRKLYVAAGGTVSLGLGGGTALRLVLAALVLAVPTLAMGGTLAAATRSIEVDGDARRRELAVLYGTNTLGAVAGAFVATFFLLEIFGTHRTIWIAALVNAVVAIIARSLGRKAPEVAPSTVAEVTTAARGAPLSVILAASAIVGFAFFLMEMTWYRMLGPILGGTVFTFGLILAVALLGIGIGGLAYALRPAAKPATVRGLVLTCLLEAVGLAIPLALGDRVAFAAGALRGTSVFGFSGQIVGWAVICAVVVMPAAIAAGIQFPLLVNLVGRGRAEVGRHLGWVYAANTSGAILGSLLGGFILLPALGAIGCWRLAIVLLVTLGIAATVVIAKATPRRALGVLGAIAGFALLLATARGPTAAWRHSGIGANRAAAVTNPSSARGFSATWQRKLKWERDGVESSVALVADDGYAFVVNGKVDGGVFTDAGTQMMGGLVGAAIHPAPKRALVIGLGTGETAGWLADAPGIERVDVVELEPAILEVAAKCAAANRNVLANPKVHVRIGDAREALLVGDDRYDIIFSEPSNPYRAGVAGLYTREFYEAVGKRLADGGLFLQWTQSYEVDGETIATIYATLGSVFPELDTWRLDSMDLLFVASATPIRYDAARIAERVRAPVFRDALSYGWRVEGVEGLMSHFIGSNALTKEVASRAGGDLNTDDQTLIEFAFARSLGQYDLLNILPLRAIATELKTDRPAITGAFDWGRFEELRAFADAVAGYPAKTSGVFSGDRLARVQARHAYVAGNARAAWAAWQRQSAEPETHLELLLRAEGLATAGDDAALAEIAPLRVAHPAEADIILARLRERQHRLTEATDALVAALVEMRTDPLVDIQLARHAVQLVHEIVDPAPAQAPRLVEALSQPFALYLVEEARIVALLATAQLVDDATFVKALEPIEPNVPWTLDILVRRRAAYHATDNALADRADSDLEDYLAGQATALLHTTASTGPEESASDR